MSDASDSEFRPPDEGGGKRRRRARTPTPNHDLLKLTAAPYRHHRIRLSGRYRWTRRRPPPAPSRLIECPSRRCGLFVLSRDPGGRAHEPSAGRCRGLASERGACRRVSPGSATSSLSSWSPPTNACLTCSRSWRRGCGCWPRSRPTRTILMTPCRSPSRRCGHPRRRWSVSRIMRR